MRLGSCRVQFKGEGVEQLGDDINMNLYIKNIEDIKNACIKKEIDYPPAYYRTSITECGNIVIDVYSEDEIRREDYGKE